MSQMDFSAEGLGLRAEDLGEGTFRAALAELIGTLLFVFIGCGAVVVLAASVGSLGDQDEFGATFMSFVIAIALAHGLAIGVLVAATAKVSGGHLNPAVTFGAIVTRRMKLGPGIVYIAAQLIGAVLGALLLDLVLKDGGNLGAHSISDLVDGNGSAVVVEIVLTFILVFTVFATAMDPRGMGNLAPFAIGFAVLIDHFVGVPLTGASMNPARSFGPALVAGEWDDHWIYWAGPLLGGALAAVTYMLLYMNRPLPTEEAS
jgi:aquaporin TIP